MHLEQRSRLAQIERFNALKDADVRGLAAHRWNPRTSREAKCLPLVDVGKSTSGLCYMVQIHRRTNGQHLLLT